MAEGLQAFNLHGLTDRAIFSGAADGPGHETPSRGEHDCSRLGQGD